MMILHQMAQLWMCCHFDDWFRPGPCRSTFLVRYVLYLPREIRIPGRWMDLDARPSDAPLLAEQWRGVEAALAQAEAVPENVWREVRCPECGQGNLEVLSADGSVSFEAVDVPWLSAYAEILSVGNKGG